MELVHQVRYSLPYSSLCAAHLPALASVGFLVRLMRVVEPVAEPLDAPEGVVAELAAFGFGKVGETGANAGVERHYAMTACGLNVALHRVVRPANRGRAPAPAGIPCSREWPAIRAAVPAWCDRRRAPSRRRHVAGLHGVLAAAVAELGERLRRLSGRVPGGT